MHGDSVVPIPISFEYEWQRSYCESPSNVQLELSVQNESNDVTVTRDIYFENSRYVSSQLRWSNYDCFFAQGIQAIMSICARWSMTGTDSLDLKFTTPLTA
jgi:hypothetical protein